MESTQKINADTIISNFMEYVLENEKAPKTIYAFAKHCNFEEQEFYDYFSSFEHLEKEIFKAFLDNTLALLNQNEQYLQFPAKEQLISFYYTFFELLTANRSYVLFMLKDYKGKLETLGMLSELRKAFKAYIRTLNIETIDLKQEKLKEFQEKGMEEAAWIQLMLTIKFWLDDTSKGFEKTDIFIEKSIQASFDIMDTKVLNSILDFGKFIFNEKMKTKR
ncbi:TetR family transcriptional regulator C-terminal domain-containing protein [Aureivirga marina]|uniref:TetR family transcriptional regulator C-terminal domain-containing protein n=1 Tax=Aureivirga marina TaxID=1182451 RepID=UPI0018CB3516|nr:TetR family transcriptional regulator C-terminal domain-containing protein [Aureivirga marina]